jgi:hypothetical protein
MEANHEFKVRRKFRSYLNDGDDGVKQSRNNGFKWSNYLQPLKLTLKKIA